MLFWLVKLRFAKALAQLMRKRRLRNADAVPVGAVS
jgi:hypothetical protein